MSKSVKNLSVWVGQAREPRILLTEGHLSTFENIELEEHPDKKVALSWIL